MTFDQRVSEIVGKGFTPRQARFLVTVMLHSGVCMIRQYCAFAGQVYGQAARDFFRELTSRKVATAFDCKQSRARLYHVHNRTLYDAIGEPHSRLRKPQALARAVEHVMLLDAIIARHDVTWLATEREKVEHFSLCVGSRIRRDEFPHLTFGDGTATTIRYFPDRLPIGVEPHGRGHVFVYLVAREVPVDFRPFLFRHAHLLRALPAWTIQLLAPMHFAKAAEPYLAAAQQELAMPLRQAVVNELRWFFEERRRIATSVHGGTSSDPARYERLKKGFGAPRYSVLYRTWMHAGDRALDALESRVLAEALERNAGRLEWQLLPRPYLHLSPLVGTA